MNELIAEYSRLSNDLFWSVYVPTDGMIRWTGYNDNFWWDKVSKSQQFREKVGKSGRVYTLDPDTARVTVREDASHE